MRVVITRPLAQARALAECIAAAHAAFEPLIFPTLAIGPAPDPALLDAALGQLDSYRLVVFVSPNAIAQTFARLARPWPAAVAVAVMGPGSLAALRARGVHPPAYRVFAPPGHAQVEQPRFDSEALLAQLDLASLRGQRVLIVKGNGGRPWLARQLSEAGVRVDTVESYQRFLPQPGESERGAMAQLIDRDERAVVVITSSEGLANLLTLLQQLRGERGIEWLRQCPVLVPHARIAENATAAQLPHVHLTGPGDQNITRALEWVSP